jgi:YqjK-like protein
MLFPRNAQQQALAERQRALLRRSALLRFELFNQGRKLGESMALADQTYAGWQHLKAHPILLLGALLVLSAGRPRRLLRWLPRLWWGWDLLKKARRWVKEGP